MPISGTRVGVALGAGALLLLAVVAGPVLAADSDVSIVEVSDKYAFQPGTITVAVGDSVTWTNNSDAPHTVTADDDSWGSDQLGDADTFTQTFDTAGTYAYHCAIHDYMKGTVKVLAAGATPPATDTAPTDATPASSSTWLAMLAVFAGLVLVFAWLLARRTRAAQGTLP